MTELSPTTRSLLAKARDGRLPTAADRDRVRASLAAALPAPAPSTPPSQAPPPAASAGSTLSAKLGVLAAIGAVTGALITVFMLWNASAAPLAEPSRGPQGEKTNESAAAPAEVAPALSVAEPAPLADDQPVTEAAVEPVGRPTRTTPPRAPAPAPSEPEPPVAEQSTLAAQLALVTRATRAIHAEPELARQLSEEYLATYPEGAFRQEARSARVLAACAAGAPDSRARAQQFLARFGGSAYAERVRRACGAPPVEEPTAPDTDR